MADQIVALTHEVARLELRGIGKAYPGADGGVRVLKNVSLQIRAGELVAIMGASGSGKSTLLNILGCLDRPSEGTYFLDGVEVDFGDADALARIRREVFGFVFQQYHLIAGMTARQNVEMPATYTREPRRRRSARAEELLCRLGLKERVGYRKDQLSGGQQQRVSVARALMNRGQILLADEPTGALDSHSGSEVMLLLRELSDQGHTVVVVTHDPKIASAARRVIEIQDGEVISDTGAMAAVPVGVSPSQPGPSGDSFWNRVLEAITAAGFALRVNPIRTALTLLGVVVGVASVVVLLAIGEGAKQAVLAQLAVFGTNRLYVVPGSSEQRGPGGALNEADASVVRGVPGVTAAMPYLKGPVTVRYGNVDHRTNGVAVTADFTRILNWRVDRGVFFTPVDERGLATVALVGKKLEHTLFPEGTDSLRKFVLIDNVPFQLIGVLSEKGALTGDADDDDTIVFPFSTGSQRLFGTPNLSWISVLIDDIGKSDAVVDAITSTLTEKHRIKDFDVYNKAASVAAQTETMDIMTSLLTVTAAVSLLVGGIGVMNIMFMTVTERTREIGIRMASGARRRDILWQFLAEAVVLSGAGGTVGLLLGFGGALAAALVGMPVLFSVRAALLAFGCAVATGLVFGYLPAQRAAKLEPVLALVRE